MAEIVWREKEVIDWCWGPWEGIWEDICEGKRDAVTDGYRLEAEKGIKGIELGSLNEGYELLLEEFMTTNMQASGNLPSLNVNMFLSEFRNSIKECILTGKPVEDITWSSINNGKNFTV